MSYDFLSAYGLSMRDLLPYLYDLGVLIQGRSYALDDIAMCVKDESFQRLFLAAFDETIEKLAKNNRVLLVQAAHGKPITREEHAKLVEELPWHWIMEDVRWAAALNGMHRRYEALAKLGEKECIVLRLRYLFDQPDGVIASIIGVKAGPLDEYNYFPFPKHPEIEKIIKGICQSIAREANDLYRHEREAIMARNQREAESTGYAVKLDDLRIQQRLRYALEDNDIVYAHQLTKIRIGDLPVIARVGPAAHHKLAQEMRRHGLYFKQ